VEGKGREEREKQGEYSPWLKPRFAK